MTALRFLVVLAWAALLAGCGGSALSTAIVATNEAAEFTRQAHGQIEQAHAQALEVAVEQAPTRDVAEASVSRVHLAFAPVWDAYEGLRLAVLGTRAAVQAAQLADAAGESLYDPALLGHLLLLRDAVEAFRVAIEAIR